MEALQLSTFLSLLSHIDKKDFTSIEAALAPDIVWTLGPETLFEHGLRSPEPGSEAVIEHLKSLSEAITTFNFQNPEWVVQGKESLALKIIAKIIDVSVYYIQTLVRLAAAGEVSD
ncbi:hypothetical protein RQP46_006667 [Phenoliferia psychrophenolica]